MAKKKSSKQALLTSLLSLVLCISMLIGSTFAWFTDSVTSDKNTIHSGNLKVGLKYSTDMNNWQDVEGKSEIFNSQTEWEPGHVEVVYFKIVNEGSLALKYQFGLNLIKSFLGKTEDGQDIDLTQYLKFGIVTDVTTAYEKSNTGRTQAVAAVTDPKNFGNYTSGVDNLLQKDDYDTIAMVVYMPETVGNEANHDGTNVPKIDFGISVVATQHTYENDSFNNQYDQNAEIPKLPDVGSANISGQVGTTDVQLTDNGVTVTIPANLNNTSSGSDVSLNGTNVSLVVTPTETTPTSIKLDISLYDSNNTKITSVDTPLTITRNIGIGLKGVVVYHNGVAMTANADVSNLVDQQYNYDATTGILTIKTKTFSPFEIFVGYKYAATIGEQGFLTLQDAIDAVNNGETITLGQDLTLDQSIEITKNITIDLNGNNINFEQNQHFKVKENGTLELKGSGIVKELAPYYAPVVAYGFTDSTAKSNIIIGENVTLEGWSGIMINQVSNATSYKMDITVNGKLNSVRDITGSVGGAIYVNGSITNETLYPTITLNETAKLTSIGYAVYAAGYAQWNINGASLIGDETGMEIRAGILNMTAGTLIGNGTPLTVNPNGNGSTTSGAGLAISQHTKECPIQVNISGGHIQGEYALNQSTTNGKAPEKIAIVITGGTFLGKVYSENCTKFIQKGTFNSNVDTTYLADNHSAILGSGDVIVTDSNGLKDALSSLNDGESITIKLVTGTYQLPALDLGNKHIVLEGENGTVMVNPESQQVSVSGGNGGSLTIRNITFTGANKTGMGIGVSENITGATLIVENCTFDSLGNGICLGNMNNATIKNSTFMNCKVGIAGSQGITETLLVENCTFTDNDENIGWAGTGTLKIVNSIIDVVSCYYPNKSNVTVVNKNLTMVGNIYSIGTADELFQLANDINVVGYNYSGLVCQLSSNIDLQKKAWTPIGQTEGAATEFKGTFDGNNYTISNLSVDSSSITSKSYSSGLFGFTQGITIKNLTLDNATIIGHHYVGALVGYAYGSIENCHVLNSTITNTYANDDASGDKTGALVGYLGEDATIKNSTATNCIVSSARDAGQIVGCAKEVSVTGCTATNVIVSANGTDSNGHVGEESKRGSNINNTIIGRLN